MRDEHKNKLLLINFGCVHILFKRLIKYRDVKVKKIIKITGL